MRGLHERRAAHRLVEVLVSARAGKWTEENVFIDARRFFLMDGEWFEIGADYVRASRDANSRLFLATPDSALASASSLR